MTFAVCEINGGLIDNVYSYSGRSIEIKNSVDRLVYRKSDLSHVNVYSSHSNSLARAETHSKNILNAYEKIKTQTSKDTILSIALAEHLFSELASGYSYSIDARAQGKGEIKTCKCGCNKEVAYDATGVGHHMVWHGYVDVLFHGNNSPMGAAKVVIDPLSDPGGDYGPTSAKRLKTEDEDCPGMSSREGSSRNKNWNQALAQTIVFALAQHQRHPNVKSFIPNILISQKEFYIIMYDPVNDVLINSGAIRLWKNHSPTSLNLYAVITLWMVIHYKLFCKSGEILENIHEVKAGFFDGIVEEKKDYYNQLVIGVANFETVDEHYCGHRHGDCEDFEHVRLKVN
ncbi:hypothetical protein FSP39_007687 [Pinctada imbricata]|uniref:Uncharacterized protein n=1 Tax=Pinctada imbricata TaxID=66713 RepID=A0AA88YBK1_PINIB|nr:hypothetical protein FSP39_007687 [Pinctada imbricata]